MENFLDSLTENLNEEQAQAVTAPLSNMLILAGAGTGKTRVLVHRIAYLIHKEKINQANILAVTFTNKAASEMKERLRNLLGEEETKYLWACTFHGASLKILKNFASEAKLSPNFSVIDTSDQTRIIKDVLDKFKIDNKDKKLVKEYVNAISSAKEKGLRPYDSINNYPLFNELYRFTDVYAEYQNECEKREVVDFSELLLRSYELLKSNEKVRDIIHTKFKQILVDEFQDTNNIQYSWLKLIVSKTSNILVVGDDDQSIYGWRGAEFTNMEKFRKEYNSVTTIKLVKNYRSINSILQCANSLISLNTSRLEDKVLVTDKENKDRVKVIAANSEYGEADLVCDMVNHWNNKGFNLKDIAILYRTNAQSRVLEKSLVANNISYNILGGLRFYDREEIKNVLAYIRIVLNHNDDVSFERIINVPSRKIGKTSVEKIRVAAIENNISMFEACELLSKNTKSKQLSNFVLLIKKLTEDLKNNHTSLAAVYTENMLDEVGLLNYYKNEDEKQGQRDEGTGRVDNIYELLKELDGFTPDSNDFEEDSNDNVIKISTKETLENFANMSILATSGEGLKEQSNNNAVQLMTIHCAKGLEFPCVIVVGVEKGLFPNSRNEQQKRALEEERRLAYVAITRAKDNLILTYSKMRRNYDFGYEPTGPSIFIKEIDRDYIDFYNYN